MGLAGGRPWDIEWTLLANDVDITEAIRDRLASLTISDSAGMESDTLDVAISDHSPGVKLPPMGTELVCTLDNVRMGLFVVDEISLSGPPPLIKLKAKAASFEASHGGLSQLQTQKTRSWEDMALKAMVDTIASEHGLKGAVSEKLAGMVVAHCEQVNESDIAFLTRIAYRYDATAKPVEGRLVIVPKGIGCSVSGQSLPITTIRPNQVTRWQVNIKKREVLSSVVAVYRDVNTGEDIEVRIGAGEPVRRLMHIFPDEATARQYAEGERKAGKREGAQLSLSMYGDPRLKAEGLVSLSGFRSGTEGIWTIETARHSLSSQGYTTQLNCKEKT